MSDLPTPEFPPFESQAKISDIRQRLRKWELENASAFVPILEPVDHSKPGVIRNTLTRPQDGEYRVAPDDADALGEGMPLLIFDRDELVDVGNKRAFLLTGDLVELMYVCSLIVSLASPHLSLGQPWAYSTEGNQIIN